MGALYRNFQSGTITDNPLSAGSTTVNSSAFANLPTIAAPDTMWIVLDPTGVNGAPEIVQVTAHAGAATAVTVVRAQQSTVARSHPSGSTWLVATTQADLDELPFRKFTAAGDMLYASAVNEASRLAAGTSSQVLIGGTTPSWGQVTSAMITDGTIVNADINAAAAIGYGKLALSNSIVNADVATGAAIGYGKLALTGSIVNADVATNAAIALSKLATGTAGTVVLHNASGVPTATALSGDVTVSNAGVTTIGASRVTSSMIVDGTIVTADLADGAVTSAKILDGTIVGADVANATLTGAKMLDEAFSGFGPLSSGINVGTGAANGRYFKLGNLVFFHVDIELGTGFSVGTAPVLQIPSAAFFNGGVGSWQHTYDIRYWDASATTWFGGKGVWSSASTYKLTYLVSFGGQIYADVSATGPFTWAVGDRIMLSGWYEEA